MGSIAYIKNKVKTMITTIKERLKELKKFLAVVGITVVASIGGITGDYYFTPDVDLLGEKLTKSEYAQLRKEVGQKASDNAFNEYNQIEMYAAILNIEKEKCNNRMYPVKNNQDIRDQVKNFDLHGCP